MIKLEKPEMGKDILYRGVFLDVVHNRNDFSYGLRCASGDLVRKIYTMGRDDTDIDFLPSISTNVRVSGNCVSLHPTSIKSYIMLDLLLFMTNLNVHETSCIYCGKHFVFGENTERRSSSKFCSDACRKATHVIKKREDK